MLFLLANTMLRSVGATETQVTFLNVHKLIPKEAKGQPTVPGLPRVVAIHHEYTGQIGRAVYLLRHPGDVMASYYDYLHGRWSRDIGSFSTSIRDNNVGLPAWVRHVESWERQRHLLICYEDLLRDPLPQLKKMATLFPVGLHDDILNTAVALSTFDNMKRIEAQEGLPRKPGANPDYTFVRKGNYARGEGMFSSHDYRYLSFVAGKILDRYGYVGQDASESGTTPLSKSGTNKPRSVRTPVVEGG